jgi:hypothetical protein
MLRGSFPKQRNLTYPLTGLPGTPACTSPMATLWQFVPPSPWNPFRRAPSDPFLCRYHLAPPLKRPKAASTRNLLRVSLFFPKKLQPHLTLTPPTSICGSKSNHLLQNPRYRAFCNFKNATETTITPKKPKNTPTKPTNKTRCLMKGQRV